MPDTVSPGRFAAILLDLDGTLIDTIGDIADAGNAMLADLQRPLLTQDRIRDFVGKGTRKLVERMLAQDQGRRPDSSETDHALAIFNRHYHRVNGARAVVYPGVIAGLRTLRGQGRKLAVVTNKPAEFTLPLLERTGLDGFFDTVVSGDSCPRRKPHPMPLLHACALLDVTPARALAVGDSMNDALAARAAGIQVLAVPYGYSEGLDVRDFDVDDIVSCIESVARWVANVEKNRPAP